MSILVAEKAMRSLESASCEFNPEKTVAYAANIRVYMKRKMEAFPNRPALFDVSEGTVELPTDLADRIERWMSKHPSFNPFMRRFAGFYLIAAISSEKGLNVYEPLAECVREGGYFYIENGVFFFPDCTGVGPIERR